MARKVDPTANTAGYRFIKRIPDTTTGLRVMHALAFASGWMVPRGTRRTVLRVNRGWDDGDIVTEIFSPLLADRPLPLLLHLHGGGFAIGAPRQDYALFSRLMAAHPCVIVAPHYRRSLQAPYPAALNDCHDVLIWLKENAQGLGGRVDQIMVMGESAGGGLAAALCLMARDRADVRIACQFPLYAMLDDQPSDNRLDPSILSWSVAKNRLAWDMYVGEQPITVYAAPARATDVSDLPPAIGMVGDCDLFHAENQTYFERLRQAQVPTQFMEIPGAYHGTEVFAPRSESGHAIMAYLSRTFEKACRTIRAAQ